MGRPRIETDQPGLCEAIIRIATYGSPAHERRRSEALRSITKLDELCLQLRTEGYQISKSATYLRLLPKRSNTIEGKRHVNTVPVRLKRATNDLHKVHADAKFCTATINCLDEVASILGSQQVLFISQDDKARVPIGITAANKQAPMLMHLDYQVKLPDHDWVVAERHKLIPSVYGFMNIKDGMIGDRHAVTYSGPTYIEIRNGKHCSSTASSHGKDFDTIMLHEDFLSFTRNDSGEVKPVVILVVDGGPDENPRYEKVINEAILTFKKYDLDALFIATNAPGRSAYNRVERRMSPLSRELCGVLLKPDHFGTHLDNRGRTIDRDLELKNFEHAGETLAEIWSSMTIDGFATKAEYVKPENCYRDVNEFSTASWKGHHVRESHYFLQITKCDDLQCCPRHRGNYRKLLPRFLPAPLCLDQMSLEPNDNTDLTNRFSSLLIRLQMDDTQFRNSASDEVPYDLCCPSVKELIDARTCKKCGLYFASVKSMKFHKGGCSTPDSALNADTSFLKCRRNNRPVRVEAQREDESLVVYTTRLLDEHADWMENEELIGIEIQPNENLESNLSVSDYEVCVFDLGAHQSTPWENDV